MWGKTRVFDFLITQQGSSGLDGPKGESGALGAKV